MCRLCATFGPPGETGTKTAHAVTVSTHSRPTVPFVLATVFTFAIDGVDPRPVTVEVDVRPGLPSFTVVGLGDTAVRESRERIRAAVQNAGFRFPQQRITANLAPASLRKSGPGFDAAIALALLAASDQLNLDALDGVAVYGELSLGGELRDAPGALAAAEGARRAVIPRLIVPSARAAEAALVDGIRVAGVGGLRDAVEILSGRRTASAVRRAPAVAQSASRDPDLCDVRGHALPIAALEIAAAGSHNLLFEGPPGTGKTMLARRLPSILPPLSREDALEVTRIHSITGVHRGGLVTARPFRAPHHTISPAGLVGGGVPPRPGEASLAHLGVLFLDELSEFQRPALEGLRQPLEDGAVTVVRGQRALTFPTRVMLVAATNPCPCGYGGTVRCRCGELELRRHERRLSGPLLDRIDLLIAVERPTQGDLEAPPVTDSAAARDRVCAARERQRFRLRGSGADCNGTLDARQVRTTVVLEPAAQRLLARAYTGGALSARGRHRALRIARTIGDLAGHDRVAEADVLLALSLRQRSGGEQTAPA